MPKSYKYSFDYSNGMPVPMLPVRVENVATGKSVDVLGLVDTGCYKSCFPRFIIENTGSKLEFAFGRGVAMGITGKTTGTWQHKFRIHLLSPMSYKPVYTIRSTPIDFMENNNIPPLLGQVDFLKNLKITLDYIKNSIVVVIP